MAEVQRASWWTQALTIGAIVGAALLPIGALGHRVGLWSFATGFIWLAGGTFLSLIAFVGGLVALLFAWRSRRTADRPPFLVALGVAAAILAIVLVQVAAARAAPPIHDVTTDPADPPMFDKVVALRGASSNSLDYDADKLAPLQRGA